MKKNVFVLIALSVLLISCAASSVPVQQEPTSVQLVAQTEITNVYKFQDGLVVCFFTESRYAASSTSAGGIVCR